jgi:hypothetical protein
LHGFQDPPQSGYLPNHNINATEITSWTKSWENEYNANEEFQADPLVYTPTGSAHELVIVVSSQNIVRIIDGVTGALVQNRTLDPPFSAADALCTNNGKTIGITGTPIIDPTTSTLYFYAKSYANGLAGPQSTLAGSAQQHSHASIAFTSADLNARSV